MSAYLALSAHGPAEQELVLIDGVLYTWVVTNQEYGSPDWQHGFSGARGTQGAKPIQGTLPNRAVVIGVRGQAPTAAAAYADLADLEDIIDSMRRYGGRITQRHHQQDFRQHYDVFVGSSALQSWGAELENRHEMNVVLTFTCAPYALGDPLDVRDGFSSDTLGDYTVDFGDIDNVAVDAGQLTPLANLATETRLVHTLTGHQYGDHEATIRFTVGAVISGFRVAVVLKRLDSATYLEVYVDDTGSTSRLRVDSVTSAGRTNIDTVNLTRLVAGNVFWLRGRIEANTVYSELWSTDPDSYGPTGTQRVVQLGSGDRTQFGIAMRGMGGFGWTPQDAAARLDDFAILPFTYRAQGSLTVPQAGYLHPAGEIPGNAPALGEVSVTAGGTAFGMISWAPAPPEPVNLLRDGGFESADPAELPWIFATASGGLTGTVTGASGQSVVRPLFGAYSGSFVTASANTGAQQKVWGRFRANVTYTFEAWIYGYSGTTPVRLRVGSGADIASSSATAVSAAWSKRSIAWTPTADVDFAWVAVETTTGSSVTLLIDGAKLFEGSIAPTNDQANEGFGTVPPFGTFPASWGDSTTLVDTAAGGATFGRWRVVTPGAGAHTYSLSFDIEPSGLPPDDYSGGQVEVEVWADLVMSAANGAVTASLYARQLDSIVAYAGDTGSLGRVLGQPAAANGQKQTHRLGTVVLPIGPGRARTKLVLQFDMANATNGQLFGVDHVHLVPARSRCLTPTGEPRDIAYPFFVPSGLTWGTRVVRSDLSGSVIDHGDDTRQPGPFEVADAALGGALVELPTGPMMLALKLGSTVPDEPSQSEAQSQSYGVQVHVAVVPRWQNVRDA